tara:strand:- start:831 stop:1433 length:603 start_codon:yes stop_codon:yes gene_type:complete
MALLGQASGAWTESSSALRILHVGIRNTTGTLVDDAFTQSNPTAVGGNATSDQLGALGYTNVLGVLSGSVACVRGDNQIGGPSAGTEAVLGVFINNANGNAFENTPGVASDKGPYVSAQGTYANALFETFDVSDASGATACTYTAGDKLAASLNGFICSVDGQGSLGTTGLLADGDYVTIGILKMPADSVQGELVYDQRI